MTLQQQIDDLRDDAANAIEKLKAKGRVWLIVLGVAVLAVIILLVTVFKPKNNSAAMERIEALDSVIKYQQQKIDALEQLQSERDSTIANLEKKVANNKPTIIKYQKRIDEDIPNNTPSDKPGIRDEFTNY